MRSGGRLLAALAVVAMAATTLATTAAAAPTATAAATPVAAATATGGVVLDGWGGLHPFGGFTLDTTGAPFWLGQDIARGLAVREDGSGGWTLDGYGGVHAFGDAAPVSTDAYWQGWDIARAIVVTSRDASGRLDGRHGYVLDGWGGVHPWGGAPQLAGAPYRAGQDWARGLEIHLGADGTPDGGWVMDATGRITAFGAAPPLAAPAAVAGPVWRQLHASGGSAYTVGRWGVVAGAAPSSWSAFPRWDRWDIARDVILVSPQATGPVQPVDPPVRAEFVAEARGVHGGVTLDGWGGLHAFGGMALDRSRAPYWQGWDIARAVALRPDGSGGWVLDGWGGVHAFGSAAPVRSPAYWGGWDIARAVVVTSSGPDGLPDGRQGYVLDGFGGLHPWGGAPRLGGAPYRQQDWARGLEIHYGDNGLPDGGWVMDAEGQTFPFGNAPALGGTAAYPGHQLWRQLHLADRGWYLAGRFGVTSIGGEVGNPWWSGYSDFGGWDITRDVVLVATTAPAAQLQPVSAAAARAFATTAFDLSPYKGLSAWADVFDWSRSYTNGHPTFGPADIDRMADAGVNALFLQTARWDSPRADGLVDLDLLQPILDRARARGVQVVSWYLPTLTDVQADLRRLVAAANVAGGIAVDIEARNVADVNDRNARLVSLSRQLRAALPGRVIGAITMPGVVTDIINPNFWPDFPWAGIAPSYDVWMPMSYWTNRTTSSGWRDGYKYSVANVNLLRSDLHQPAAPVNIIGGITGDSSVGDIQGMTQAVFDTGSIGGGLYDWANTTADKLAAQQPLRRLE
jgi:hypothetical protein